jgi:DNA (cytosine-5)-methyltransferase 1
MGLHHAGFEPVNVIEWNRYCCDTLRENKARGVDAVKRWKLTAGDVRDVDFRKYENKVQLVSGGPPCQPFSLGGKHRAHQDTRDMFSEAIRAVRHARPKAFIFENVKGLTRASFRNYFEYIRLQMEHPEIERRKSESWADHLVRLERHYTIGSRSGLCYRVVTQVLNAADFGVPQRRERVFFIGFREDVNVSWSFPLPTHSQEALLWDQVRGDYWERHGVAKKLRRMPAAIIERVRRMQETPNALAWQTVRDALRGVPILKPILAPRRNS